MQSKNLPQTEESRGVTAELYQPKPLNKSQTIGLSIKLLLGTTVFGVLLWLIEAAVN